LEDKFRFDIGSFLLEVIHTPGHTSGSVCLYEVNRKLLFTGDTIFARGTLSYISESGSIGDYINSIGRLGTIKVKEIYPGHGNISKSPEDDMRKAILNAEKLLNDQAGVEIARESRPAIPLNG
jgi:glyoxylase-like metal-dependent hydrolase (beta-lactamase superfamily II)